VNSYDKFVHIGYERVVRIGCQRGGLEEGKIGDGSRIQPPQVPQILAGELGWLARPDFPGYPIQMFPFLFAFADKLVYIHASLLASGGS
jgi:hypothetical protein